MEKHVVVIYPHPDDESFGSAGTIAGFRKQGVPVTYLCGTLGEMGRNMGTPPFANRETLPEIRKEELQAACKELDMDVKMLGYRDKTVEFEDRQQVADHLQTFLEDIQPSLVITHYPPYAVHPDHNAMGAAAIQAVGQMDDAKRPVVWAQAISKNFVDILGEPDIVNDVTPVIDKKMAAIMSHKSQANGVLSQFHDVKEDQEAIREKAKEALGQERFYIWEKF